MNRRASCIGTFEVFEAAHVALGTLLAFSQPVNCIFWPIGMLNWLVAASKHRHKHRETCCTAEWPFYSFLILCLYDTKMTIKRASASIFNNFIKYIQFQKHMAMKKQELVLAETINGNKVNVSLLIICLILT